MVITSYSQSKLKQAVDNRYVETTPTQDIKKRIEEELAKKKGGVVGRISGGGGGFSNAPQPTQEIITDNINTEATPTFEATKSKLSPQVQKVLTQLEQQGQIKSYSIIATPSGKSQIQREGIYRPTMSAYKEHPVGESIKFYSSVGAEGLTKSREFIISKSGKYQGQVSDFFHSGFNLVTRQPKTFTDTELRQQDQAIAEGALFMGVPALFVARGEETIIRALMGKKDIQENLKSLGKMESEGQAFLPFEKEIVAYSEPALDIIFGGLGVAGQVKAVNVFKENLDIAKFEKAKANIIVERYVNGEKIIDKIYATKNTKNIKGEFYGQNVVDTYSENPKLTEEIGRIGQGNDKIILTKDVELNLKDKIFFEGKGRTTITRKGQLSFDYTEFDTGGNLRQIEQATSLNKINQGLKISKDLTEVSAGEGTVYTKKTGQAKVNIEARPRSSFIDIGGQDLRYAVNLEKVDLGLQQPKYKKAGGISKQSEVLGEENIIYGLGLEEIKGSTTEIFRGKVNARVKIKRIEMNEGLPDTDSFMIDKSGRKSSPKFIKGLYQEEPLIGISKIESEVRQQSKLEFKQEQKPKSKAIPDYSAIVNQAMSEGIIRPEKVRTKPITRTSIKELQYEKSIFSDKLISGEFIKEAQETKYKTKVSERFGELSREDTAQQVKQDQRLKELLREETQTKQVSKSRQRDIFNIEFPMITESPRGKEFLFGFPRLKGKLVKRKTKQPRRTSGKLIYSEDFLGRLFGTTRKVSRKQLLKESKRSEFDIGMRAIPSLID